MSARNSKTVGAAPPGSAAGYRGGLAPTAVDAYCDAAAKAAGQAGCGRA